MVHRMAIFGNQPPYIVLYPCLKVLEDYVGNSQTQTICENCSECWSADWFTISVSKGSTKYAIVKMVTYVSGGKEISGLEYRSERVQQYIACLVY